MRDGMTVERATTAEVAAAIAEQARNSIAERGRFVCVLAGGATPRGVYAALRELDADWEHWTVLLTDERCLPAGHGNRNDTMVRAALVDRVPVGRFVGFDGELGAQEAARRATDLLAGFGTFDLVVLGLGADGHTASLFDLEATRDPSAVVAVHDAPNAPAERVSMGAARLADTRSALFLVDDGDADDVKSWAVEQLTASAAADGAGTGADPDADPGTGVDSGARIPAAAVAAPDRRLLRVTTERGATSTASPTLPSPPAAVVFDFDGVLVDSVDIKTGAFAQMYRSHGPWIVEQVCVYHLANGGMSRYRKLDHFERELLGRDPSPDEIEKLAEQFADLVVEQVVAADEMPGAVSMLEALHGRVPLYLASGTPEVELVEIVGRRGWLHYFEGVYGSPTRKDGILRQVAGQLDVPTAQLVMVGDAMTDHEGARDAGAAFVGYAPGRDPFPPGTRTITHLTELAGLVVD